VEGRDPRGSATLVKTAGEGARGGCERGAPSKKEQSLETEFSKDAYALFSPSLCSPLSLAPFLPLSVSLLEPKYNDQSSAIPFFDRSTRHVGGTHVESRDRLRWDSLYAPQ